MWYIVYACRVLHAGAIARSSLFARAEFQAMDAKVFVPIHFGTLQLALDNELHTLKRIIDLQRIHPEVKMLEIGKNYPLRQILDS